MKKEKRVTGFNNCITPSKQEATGKQIRHGRECVHSREGVVQGDGEGMGCFTLPEILQ